MYEKPSQIENTISAVIVGYTAINCCCFCTAVVKIVVLLNLNLDLNRVHSHKVEWDEYSKVRIMT